MVVGQGGGGAASCCTGAADPDLLCEDCDYADSNSWVKVETGGTISFTASHSGTFACTDKGSYAIESTYDGEGDLYAYYDMGAQKNVIYTHFYFNWKTRPAGFDNADMVCIMAAGAQNNGYSYTSWRLYAREGNTESTQVRLYYDGFNQLGEDQTIAMDTWYEVSIIYISDGEVGDDDDTISWYLDGVEVATLTNANLSLAGRPRFITIGNSSEPDPSTGVSFQVDNIEVDDDAMAAACPE